MLSKPLSCSLNNMIWLGVVKLVEPGRKIKILYGNIQKVFAERDMMDALLLLGTT